MLVLEPVGDIERCSSIALTERRLAGENGRHQGGQWWHRRGVSLNIQQCPLSGRDYTYMPQFRFLGAKTQRSKSTPIQLPIPVSEGSPRLFRVPLVPCYEPH